MDPDAGSGTYNGLSLVFLRSIPTRDVPLGMMIPPSTLLNLYSKLSGLGEPSVFCKSRSELEFSMGISSSINACPDTFVPGLLSSTYSEGYNTIVNDSKASLNCPVRYENRADSTSAL